MIFLFFLIVGGILIYVGQRLLSSDARNVVSSGRMTRLAGILFAVLALLQCFTVVPAGNIGVIDFFGNVSDNTLKAGINLINPLANIVKMSVKTQEIKENMDVPSKEGLTVGLEISVLYHLSPDKAAFIYKTVGENYAEILLEPQFRSVVRGVTSLYDAKALYTSEREALGMQILRDLESLTKDRGIEIETTPMRKITLPQRLTEAIEEKLKAEQESQRMQFILTKEKQEADRKRIEAQGIADFQAIVTKGISQQLLEWKGIEATEKLANSPNTKTIIIGAGKSGLPIILGQ